MSNFCKRCGAQLSLTDQLCPSCGEPVSSGAESSSNPYGQYNYANQGMQPGQGYTQYNQTYSQQPYQQAYMPSGETTSVAGWIGWMLLCSFLPLIGQIIIIVSARDESLKNYAKATLILGAIGVVLSIIFIALFGATVASSMENFCLFL